MGYRVGVDIGGTFTDFVIVDDEGGVSLWKEDSSADDPVAAVEKGLQAVAQQNGLSLADFLTRCESFVHGSTITTNTVIQRDGGPVGLLCTKGFRDVLYFRDGFKPERFNWHLRRPDDFADRYLRIGVTERVNTEGKVMTPLDESEVRAAARRFRAGGVNAIAVAFLWSIVNGAHEERAMQIIAEEFPGVPVLCSKDVLPEIGEWERTSATVLSAYVLPRVGNYIERLESLLAANGLPNPAQYMMINGGCSTLEEIIRRPVTTFHSGPAAAPAAAAALGTTEGADSNATQRRKAGSGNLITVDMGGTSFDVCLMRDGRPSMSRSIRVASQPIGIPGVDVHTIGAGGGSIAWIDAGGALRVGPRSAGSRPGPACYATGGTEPTVTDANVVLGYLSPEAFLGGRRRLRDDLAVAAIRSRLSEPLGLNLLQAAAGIIEVVNANMVGGIRAVSVERGIDPRAFQLVVGGGAGGLHAARLAGQLGIQEVLIPMQAPTFCAFGMTVTNVRHDYVFAHPALSTTVDVGKLDARFGELEEEARERLHRDGFADERIRLERFVDARYQNQFHDLTVTIPSVESYEVRHVEEIIQTFHDEHEARFTYKMMDNPVEFVHWRLSAIGLSRSIPQQEDTVVAELATASEHALIGQRDAYFPDFGERAPTPVYAASKLVPGAKIAGHAIVEAMNTTIVVNPGDQATSLSRGRLLIAKAE